MSPSVSKPGRIELPSSCCGPVARSDNHEGCSVSTRAGSCRAFYHARHVAPVYMRPSFASCSSRVIGPCRRRRHGPTRMTCEPHDTEGPTCMTRHASHERRPETNRKIELWSSARNGTSRHGASLDDGSLSGRRGAALRPGMPPNSRNTNETTIVSGTRLLGPDKFVPVDSSPHETAGNSDSFCIIFIVGHRRKEVHVSRNPHAYMSSMALRPHRKQSGNPRPPTDEPKV